MKVAYFLIRRCADVHHGNMTSTDVGPPLLGRCPSSGGPRKWLEVFLWIFAHGLVARGSPWTQLLVSLACDIILLSVARLSVVGATPPIQEFALPLGTGSLICLVALAGLLFCCIGCWGASPSSARAAAPPVKVGE